MSQHQRDRDPLGHIALFAEPRAAEGSGSRRLQQRASELRCCVQRANRSLVLIDQLNIGRLDDRLIGDAEIWGDRAVPAAADPPLGVEDRVLKLCRQRCPPADSLSLDAAKRRLHGSCGQGRALLRPDGREFRGYVNLLEGLGPDSADLLPKRGDTFPAHWNFLDLPPPGSRPVDIRDVSPRAAVYLDRWEDLMLREDSSAARLATPYTTYVDPHFKNKQNIIELGIRMSAANMVIAVKQKVDVVGLFAVVKKCEFISDRLSVALRLVFDQRTSNLGWQEPPWCGLGSLTSLSFLDASRQLEGGGAHFEYAKGDIPSYFYVLGLPPALAEHFCLPGLDAATLRRELAARGLPPLRGEGEHVGMCVAPMGWSWAVLFAQCTIEDVFDQGPEKGIPFLAPDRRVTDGACVPVPDPIVHVEYVDDFGIIGVVSDNLDDHAGVSPVETARQGARQLLTSAGFDVHKEDYARGIDLIGGQFNGRWLLPHQRKIWSMAMLSRVVRLSGMKVPSSLVEAIVATLGWYFLLERSSLSVFDTVYKFCRENRGKKPLRLPPSVLRELAAAEAVVPLLGVDLGATWHPLAYMFDASLRGGAVGCTTATSDELRAEAKWSTRGGWAVWLGETEDEVATNNAVMTFGQRVRAPPAGVAWDSLARWRESYRWRWEHSEHINLLEMRCGLSAVRHAARSSSSWDRRVLLFTDSMVALGAFAKGRSSSAPVLHLCRRMGALLLGLGIKAYWRHVISEKNHLDGPSRGGPLGVMPKNRTEQAVRGPVDWLRPAIDEFETTVDEAEHGTRSLVSAYPALDQLLRIRAPKIDLYRFLHLYSGHRREGDLEDELTVGFVAEGAMCIVTLVDIGFGMEHDLTNSANLDRYLAQAKAGVFDGIHAGPPCALWSRVRFLPGGPPPVRSRSEPWGLRNLSKDMQRRVDLSNSMVLAAISLVETVILAGGSGTIEHPADPGQPPYPSIFMLPVMISMESRVQATRWTFSQCMWGCPARKLTTITGVADALTMEALVSAKCNHKKHVASLSGVDESGLFRTRIAQAYPQQMCRQLALAHVRFMTRSGPLGGKASLSSQAVLSAIGQFRANRDQAVSSTAPLPEPFQRASG